MENTVHDGMLNTVMIPPFLLTLIRLTIGNKQREITSNQGDLLQTSTEQPVDNAYLSQARQEEHNGKLVVLHTNWSRMKDKIAYH